MPPIESTSPTFDTLAIVGVGLMGGSLALAAKQSGLAKRVIGLGRTQSKLDSAVELGILDAGTTSVAELAEAQFIVVCTPVDRIVADVQSVMNVVGQHAVVTDVGSVKQPVCDVLGTQFPRQFVGSHPLAGSEKGGFQHSEADLYRGRRCVVTPMLDTSEQTTEIVEQFWTTLGMDVQRMSADEHDRILAVTSHLPHVAAAALASLLTEHEAPFAATGFRDTTRVAHGEPDLWTAILQQNSGHVHQEIGRLIDELAQYKQALETNDAESLRALLESGCAGRRLFESVFKNGRNAWTS
ncbi:MAG: prephenate dehydrogenase [Planctomycetaceae bacterium]|nr:prephenate dehydrogenase [Planctomycetaceae bacterium]